MRLARNVITIVLVFMAVVSLAQPVSAATTKAAVTKVALTSGKTVVLGDSYASGEGSPPYVVGTDLPSDMCHISVNSAFANMAAGGKAQMAACSGAKTDNLLTTGQYGLPAQIKQIPADATNVVVVIGANDIDLAGATVACMFLQNCVTLGNPGMAQSLSQLQPKLENVYKGILAAAPKARLFIVEYPVIFPSDRPVAACLPGVSTASQTWLRNSNIALNQKIAAAAASVGTANPGRVVDVATAPSFTTHEICGSQLNFIAGFGDGALHPNWFGQVTLSQDLTTASQ